MGKGGKTETNLDHEIVNRDKFDQALPLFFKHHICNGVFIYQFLNIIEEKLGNEGVTNLSC